MLSRRPGCGARPSASLVPVPVCFRLALMALRLLQWATSPSNCAGIRAGNVEDLAHGEAKPSGHTAYENFLPLHEVRMERGVRCAALQTGVGVWCLVVGESQNEYCAAGPRLGQNGMVGKVIMWLRQDGMTEKDCCEVDIEMWVRE